MFKLLKEYWGSSDKPWFSWIVGTVLGIYLLVTLVLGIYWSTEPDMFPVRATAQARADRTGNAMVPGYVSVSTLLTLSETLLNKPGGYMSNDRFPPGIWLDNMPNWEYGVLVQIRDFARAMRKDFARSQSSSAEDVDLARAEPQYSFDNNSWMLPASEEQYRRGNLYLRKYLTRLVDHSQPEAQFFTRADNLNDWLIDVQKRLGSLSQRLGAAVPQERINLDTNIDSDPEAVVRVAEEVHVQTPWMELDDVFYEARGTSWALLALLRAVEIDFADVLKKKNAAVSLRNIIRELEGTQDPIWSPMVLNGSGFGFVANHSLVMAGYVARANASLIELSELLSRG